MRLPDPDADGGGMDTPTVGDPAIADDVIARLRLFIVADRCLPDEYAARAEVGHLAAIETVVLAALAPFHRVSAGLPDGARAQPVGGRISESWLPEALEYFAEFSEVTGRPTLLRGLARWPVMKLAKSLPARSRKINREI